MKLKEELNLIVKQTKEKDLQHYNQFFKRKIEESNSLLYKAAYCGNYICYVSASIIGEAQNWTSNDDYLGIGSKYWDQYIRDFIDYYTNEGLSCLYINNSSPVFEIGWE